MRSVASSGNESRPSRPRRRYAESNAVITRFAMHWSLREFRRLKGSEGESSSGVRKLGIQVAGTGADSSSGMNPLELQLLAIACQVPGTGPGAPADSASLPPAAALSLQRLPPLP